MKNSPLPFIAFVIRSFIQTGLKDFRLDASIDALILDSDPDLSLFRDLIAEYETKEFVFIAIEHDENFLSLNSRNLTKNLVTDIRQINGVSDVASIMDVPLVFNDPDDLADSRQALKL